MVTELQTDELAAAPVNTFEQIYGFELAEGMASTATRFGWAGSDPTYRRRGAKSSNPFDLRTQQGL